MPSPFAAAGAVPVTAPAVQPAPPANALKSTMLGFGSGPAAPAPAPTSAPATPGRRALAGTMMFGPGQVGPVTPRVVEAPGVPAGYAPAPPASAPAAGAPQGAFQQTMLGVARPGIAPLNPGRPPEPAPPHSAPASAPREPAPARLPPRAPSIDDEVPVAPAQGLPRGALVLVAVAGLLAAIAGVVALLWDSPSPLRAEVVLDERGTEALAISCGDCPDGTEISGPGVKATLKGGKAMLPLSRPLEVGANALSVAVQRPGLGRDEDVQLAVPVDYRVRGDLSSLGGDPPRLKVLVQAAAGSSAIVEGKAVTLDPTSGKGEHLVEVGRELEGPADVVVPFERRLDFSITPPGSEPRKGDVTLRFGIVPLRVDAPGESIAIEAETFMLSGRTLAEGRITVSGRPITVDASGRFAQLMNVSSEGETTVVVRAEAKDQAPRLVRVRVKRVASLADHAAALRAASLSGYDSVTEATPGQAVALDGEVVESRTDGAVTFLLLDVKDGCSSPPCLAKVVHGSKLDLSRGAAVGAFGKLQGLVEGPRTGARIPELMAEFVVPAAAPTRAQKR